MPDHPPVSREGYTADYRSRFEPGICNTCNHGLQSIHFWWIGNYSPPELGCKRCIDNICQEAPVMSAINICERCNSLMTGNAVSTLRLMINKASSGALAHDYSDDRTLDLCPPCVTDALAFLNNGPERGRQVFRKPWEETPENAADPMQMAITAAPICGAFQQTLGGERQVCKKDAGHDGFHYDTGYEWS